jgi:hypothetical protein
MHRRCLRWCKLATVVSEALTNGKAALSRSLLSASVKVCGCRPHDGGAAHTGAGVRKPPREMLWGGDEDIASIVADVNRWSAPCRS